MPFQSKRQARFAFGTHQPWAKRWAKETDFSKIPKRVRRKMRQATKAQSAEDRAMFAKMGKGGSGGGGGGSKLWPKNDQGKREPTGDDKKDDITADNVKINANVENGRYGKRHEYHIDGLGDNFLTTTHRVDGLRSVSTFHLPPEARGKGIGQKMLIRALRDGDIARESGNGVSDAYRRVQDALVRKGTVRIKKDEYGNSIMTLANKRTKDAGTVAGAMLAGPGGLLATPGMGGRPRKWGNRKKLKGCTCGVNVATKEQIAPGVTRIRGNLCNVHGRYGPCDAGASANRPKGGKGRKLAKPKKPVVTPEQRAAARQAEHDANRTKVLAGLGIAPDGQQALEALRSGGQADAAAIARGGFVKAGLVEQAADGSYRLTPSGRAMLSAANSGDAGRAGDIISSARDRTGARTARQAAAEQRRADAAKKRAAAAVAKKPAKGGSGKQSSSSASDAAAARETSRQAREADRERQRQADRAQRQQEHEQDRAQRQAEHAADRAQRQQEHAQDRANRVPPSQRSSRTGGRVSAGAPIVYGHKPHKAKLKAMADNPGDYLVVEDRAKPSTWHLQVKRNGKPDHGLMGSAWAALHSGFRGNVYSGPNKQEAIGKLRKLYEAEKMPIPGEKSFTVFKDDTDAYRWIARTTTAYRDRDGEIITTKALEDDAARMNATRQYGPLRYWHIGNPDPFDPLAPWGVGLDIGDCDYSIVIGRTSIESGTFKSHAIGKAFAESANDYELSPGFFHPPSEPNIRGEFGVIRRFERSVVPVKFGRASNLFTGMTVKEHRMDEQTYKARVDAFLKDMNSKGVPAEVTAGALAGMQQADKSAVAQGIAFKSDDAPADPWAALLAAFKGVVAQSQQPAEPEPQSEPVVEKAAGDEAAETPDMEDTPEDQAQDEGDYLGDMNVADFEAMLASALQQALGPLVKGMDIAGKMASHMDELKSMMGGYATKSEGVVAEIASLKARLAELEGYQPAVVAGDVEAALKGAPQAPKQPDDVDIPDDPNRPMAGLAARLMPQLYQGYDGANGWQKSAMPPNNA